MNLFNVYQYIAGNKDPKFLGVVYARDFTDAVRTLISYESPESAAKSSVTDYVINGYKVYNGSGPKPIDGYIITYRKPKGIGGSNALDTT